MNDFILFEDEGEAYNHTDFHHFGWCPLFGKIPEFYISDVDYLLNQITTIIDESRKIWINSTNLKNISEYPEWKLKKATELWFYLVTNFKFLFINLKYTINTIEEEANYIIDLIRHLIISDITLITDAEILSIFTIYKATAALDFYHNELVFDNDVDNAYLHLPKQVHVANLLLVQAKKIAKRQEETKRNVYLQSGKNQSSTTYSVNKWSDIQISLIDNDTIHIRIHDVEKKLHYTQMGFKDERKRGCVPKNSWIQLQNLILSDGKLNGYPTAKQAEIEKNISSLRKVLKSHFKINSNPIPYLKTKEYNGYKAAFKVRNESNVRENKISVGKQCLNNDLLKNTNMLNKSNNRHGLKKECPKCKVPHNAFCHICKAETTECEECHNELSHDTVEYIKEDHIYEKD